MSFDIVFYQSYSNNTAKYVPLPPCKLVRVYNVIIKRYLQGGGGKNNFWEKKFKIEHERQAFSNLLNKNLLFFLN